MKKVSSPNPTFKNFPAKEYDKESADWEEQNVCISHRNFVSSNLHSLYLSFLFESFLKGVWGKLFFKKVSPKKFIKSYTFPQILRGAG